MKIKVVTVNRKFNLGNYEMLSLGAEAELNDTDNPLEVWQILRDNIEMEFIAMQKPKPASPNTATPSKPVESTSQPQPTKKPVAPNVCPQCGGAKKPQYELCFHCHEENEGR